MADINVENERERNLTWLWALIALLAIAALMGWLAVQSERTATEAAAVEEEAVDLASTAASLAAFEGQTVDVSEAQIARVLGPRAVIGLTPAQTSMLIVLSQGAGQVDSTVVGEPYSATGTIVALDEFTAQNWIDEGSVEADFAAEASDRDYYLLADRFEQVGVADTTQQPADTAAQTQD